MNWDQLLLLVHSKPENHFEVEQFCPWNGSHIFALVIFMFWIHPNLLWISCDCQQQQMSLTSKMCQIECQQNASSLLRTKGWNTNTRYAGLYCISEPGMSMTWCTMGNQEWLQDSNKLSFHSQRLNNKTFGLGSYFFPHLPQLRN